MSNSDGWNVVSKKKSKTQKTNGRDGVRTVPRGKNNVKTANSATATKHAESDKEVDYTEADKDLCKSKIHGLLEKLRHTDFYGNLVHGLKDDSVKDIVCYGVGNFATGAAPMWQFACILILRAFLAVDTVYYYDPCTTKLELELLKDLDVQIISENERGLRPVLVPTLFYMPHCAQFLYNNVLVSNWKSLDMIVMFGNSLQEYHGRQGRTLLKAIDVLLPFLAEKPVDYSKRDLQEHFQLEYAFNDCRLVRVKMASDIELPTVPPVETFKVEDDLEVI